MRELQRDVTGFAAGHLIDELRGNYAELADVIAYLDTVCKDVIDNADIFVPAEESVPAMPGQLPGQAQPPRSQDAGFERYVVNLLIDCADVTGAPVVYEDHPTYQRLMGEIEHISQMGALVTNFTLIKPARCTTPTAAISSSMRASYCSSRCPTTRSSRRCADAGCASSRRARRRA